MRSQTAYRASTILDDLFASGFRHPHSAPFRWNVERTARRKLGEVFDLLL
jgi:hypothetical protein